LTLFPSCTAATLLNVSDVQHVDRSDSELPAAVDAAAAAVILVDQKSIVERE